MSVPELKLELDKKLLKELSQPDALLSTGYCLIVLTSLVALFTLIFQFPHPITYFIAFLAIGALQHHLSIIQHEAVHYFLFRRKWLNNWVGSIAAWSIGFTMGYRKHHFVHHKHLAQDDDPDYHNYNVYPLPKKQFYKIMVLNLTGTAAIFQFLKQNLKGQGKLSPKKESSGFDRGLIGVIVMQCLLLGGLTALGHWEYYFLFWLLPLVTIGKTCTNFRNMAEHILRPADGDKAETRLRTIYCNPIEKFFFAPMNFNYHCEHHLYLTVPWQNLPKLHSHLSHQVEYLNKVDVSEGYIKTVFKGLS